MIFFDIDTQNDFMLPDGKLYVPGAEGIHANIAALLQVAGEAGITTISTRCAHEPGDPEFELFPPHCLEGTPGAERLFNQLPNLPRREIAVDAVPDADDQLVGATHYTVKKKVFDLFSNQWLEGWRVKGFFREQDCIVFGVATDYCVRACVLGLAGDGARVRVVSDAISGVALDSTAQTLLDWQRAGVEMMTTAAVLAEIAAGHR